MPYRRAPPTRQGVTLLYGRVNDGGPVSGATILAQIWPNDTALATQADETAVPVINATTTTDANGDYTVSLDPSTVSSSYATTNGYVNVALTAVKGTQKWATYHTTVIKQPSTWATPDAGTTPQVDLDLTAGTAYDYNLAAVPSEDAAGNEAASSATQSLDVVDVASNGGFTPNVGCVTIASGSWQYSKPHRSGCARTAGGARR